MASTPYPLPKSTRQTAVLAGDGRTTYGPFGEGWGIFDTSDVLVETRPATGGAWTPATVTVSKTAPAARYSTFSITFPAAVTSATQFRVRGKRAHERQVAITRGGAIDGTALELELSKQTVVLQEQRRDIDGLASYSEEAAQSADLAKAWAESITGDVILAQTAAQEAEAAAAEAGELAETFNANFTQAGAGAVTRTISSKLRDHVSLFDFVPEAEIPAILAGTSTYDAAAAIAAALAHGAAVHKPVFGSGTFIYNSQITVPAGTGLCSLAPLSPESGVVSGLVFKKDFNGLGFLFSGHYSCAHNVHFDSATGRSGDNVQVTGSRFQSCGMAVTHAGNDGLRIGATEAGASSINANGWRIDYLYAYNNGRHGVNIDHTNTSTSGTFPLGAPDCGIGTLNVDAHANGGNGVHVGNSINNVLNVKSQANSGTGLRLAGGARGTVATVYVEANGNGDIVLDASAAQNILTITRIGTISPGITDNSGNTSNTIVGRSSNFSLTGSANDAPFGFMQQRLVQGGGFTRTEAYQYATANWVYSSVATIADGASGTKRVWSTRQSGNTYIDGMALDGTGTLDLLRATGALKIAGNQVVGPRGSALPTNATDLATAITLINAIKDRLVTHGLVG
jgi:hypothetical protein